jgi:hypothetical protein
MKHLKPFNESKKDKKDKLPKWPVGIFGELDIPKKRVGATSVKLAKKVKVLDPRILAANIKNNIDDFSEEEILNLFLTYGEQQSNS